MQGIILRFLRQRGNFEQPFSECFGLCIQSKYWNRGNCFQSRIRRERIAMSYLGHHQIGYKQVKRLCGIAPPFPRDLLLQQLVR